VIFAQDGGEANSHHELFLIIHGHCICSAHSTGCGTRIWRCPLAPLLLSTIK